MTISLCSAVSVHAQSDFSEMKEQVDQYSQRSQDPEGYVVRVNGEVVDQGRSKGRLSLEDLMDVLEWWPLDDLPYDFFLFTSDGWLDDNDGWAGSDGCA